MTRAEWKAFMHSLRSDARAFKAAHGGHPCFARYFIHNGKEWTITRRLDAGWTTHTRTSRIDAQTPRRPFFAVMDEMRQIIAQYRAAPWMRDSRKRALRLCLKDLAAYRNGTGWKAAA